MNGTISHSARPNSRLRVRLIGILSAVALTAASAVGAEQGGTYSVFLNRAAWQEAVGGLIHTENFNSQPVPPNFQMTPGINHIGLLNIEVQRLSGNLIVDGNFFDPVDGTSFWRIEAAMQNGSTPPVSPIVWFDQPVYAFGADFNFFFPPRATLEFNDQVVTFSNYIPGKRNGFFGVISTEPFNHAAFDVTDPFNTLFHADNVSFAPIPEPGAGVFAVTGLAVGAWVGGRRQVRRNANVDL